MMAKPSYRHKPVQQKVFRAYDIRGIVGDELDEDAFYSIGKAVSYRLNALNREAAWLGRDGRLTSPSLSEALKQGLLDSGIDVLDLGQVPTPVMYFASHTQKIDSGLMVTGSHNPASYNGVKMVLAGMSSAGEEMARLYEINQNARQYDNGEGHYQSHCLLDEYIGRIISDTSLKRPFKVVADCGNGVSGPIVPQVLERLGCEVIPLYCDVDGHFPNHHPDPTIESNLIDLKSAISKHAADIGLAFDGDGDRLGVMTNQGELIWPDRLMMLYARDILKRNPGRTVVYDVKCSSHLAEVIQQAGGVASMCPTGHSIVKRLMKEQNAILAGEMSGHIFFKERWYGFDDALYSACRLLEILSESTKTVSEQFHAIPDSLNTPEIKIPIQDEEKFRFMQRFIKQAKFPEAKTILIDGVRVEFDYGWGLVRASNTSPCLVVRFEARDEPSLDKIQGIFRTQLRAMDKTLKIPF